MQESKTKFCNFDIKKFILMIIGQNLMKRHSFEKEVFYGNLNTQDAAVKDDEHVKRVICKIIQNEQLR